MVKVQPTTHHSVQVREASTGAYSASLESKTAADDASRTFPTLFELIAAEKKDRTPRQQRELAAMQQQGAPPRFPPLDRETRTAVETACAAYHLNRQPQTLRGWACHEDGPLRPLRINGRLAWKTADLKRVLGVA